jgi:hypothetical protein
MKPIGSYEYPVFVKRGPKIGIHVPNQMATTCDLTDDLDVILIFSLDMLVPFTYLHVQYLPFRGQCIVCGPDVAEGRGLG